MMRGCLIPPLARRPRFADVVSVPAIIDFDPNAPFHPPNGPALSQGMLGNDVWPDCVIVSFLRYRQRQVPGFTPTDDMALAIFNALGAPPDGIDPIAFMQAAQAGTLPGIPKIGGYALVNIADGTELAASIKLTKGVMLCAAMPPQAEDQFPGKWGLDELDGAAADGHCFLADGFDLTQPDNCFDRCTWAAWTEDGIDLPWLAKFGFTAISVAFDPGKSLADLTAMGRME